MQRGRLRADLSSGALGDVEFCRVMHGLAVTAHYLLAGQPLNGDVIHQLMHLVARHAHGELGVPARVDLRAHLLHAARGEPALHALKEYYRDHFFHALQVCLLGHVLLEARVDERRCLWQLVAGHMRPRADRKKVLRLWYLAALLHDVGYAMDVLNSSREFLGFFRHSEALQHLAGSFEQAVKDLSKEEELKVLGIEIEADSKREQDHGIVGALHLRSLLERIARDDPNVDPDSYAPAVRAIALHNLRRHDDEISFARDPLAFLLALCDQVQEWRRPRLSFSTSPNQLLARLDQASAYPVELDDAFERMTTNLERLDGGEGDVNLGFYRDGADDPSLELALEYNDNVNRNSGVFQVWLDATRNLQRLRFDGLPLDIRVTFATPLYEKNGVRQSQLHRLRDAADETHMGFLQDWFPAEREMVAGEDCLTNGAVTHRWDDQGEQGWEKLTLDLRALSGKVLMTRDMGAFWNCLRKWKHFNDDRDFPGDYVSVIPE